MISFSSNPCTDQLVFVKIDYETLDHMITQRLSDESETTWSPILSLVLFLLIGMNYFLVHIKC